MKPKILIGTFAICAIVICLTIFTDLQGKWAGVFNIGGNAIDLSYVFKIDGNKLSGSVTSPQSNLPIYDGKTNGTDISFSVDVNGAPIKTVGKYYADGDSIILNTDFNGTNVHTKLARSK